MAPGTVVPPYLGAAVNKNTSTGRKEEGAQAAPMSGESGPPGTGDQKPLDVSGGAKPPPPQQPAYHGKNELLDYNTVYRATHINPLVTTRADCEKYIAFYAIGENFVKAFSRVGITGKFVQVADFELVYRDDESCSASIPVLERTKKPKTLAWATRFVLEDSGTSVSGSGAENGDGTRKNPLILLQDVDADPNNREKDLFVLDLCNSREAQAALPQKSPRSAAPQLKIHDESTTLGRSVVVSIETTKELSLPMNLQNPCGAMVSARKPNVIYGAAFGKEGLSSGVWVAEIISGNKSGKNSELLTTTKITGAKLARPGNDQVNDGYFGPHHVHNVLVLDKRTPVRCGGAPSTATFGDDILAFDVGDGMALSWSGTRNNPAENGGIYSVQGMINFDHTDEGRDTVTLQMTKILSNYPVRSMVQDSEDKTILYAITQEPPNVPTRVLKLKLKEPVIFQESDGKMKSVVKNDFSSSQLEILSETELPLLNPNAEGGADVVAVDGNLIVATDRGVRDGREKGKIHMLRWNTADSKDPPEFVFSTETDFQPRHTTVLDDPVGSGSFRNKGVEVDDVTAVHRKVIAVAHQEGKSVRLFSADPADKGRALQDIDIGKPVMFILQ
ncbi:unnamed protein product [Amoebophrya sp. A120]|nr:unnamed protein product [Amoebophrya sp. A120]|eukprot:GSA120T00015908001.1